MGYKQFERWKYWSKRNLDEHGQVRDKITALKAYEQFAHRSSSRTSFGNYTELGPQAAINTSTWSSALGRVSAIGLDPNDDNHIVVGSPTGGIWKTTDLGANWTPLFDDQALIDVYALEISHSNADHYWAGLSDGVVRSVDGGSTWYPVSGIATSPLYNTIEMHPTNASIIFAVAQSSGEVYKSVDGGENFYVVLDHTSSLYDLEFNPGNSNIVYASGNDAVFLSIDGGENFTEVTTGPWSGNLNAIMMAVTPAAPNSIYALEEIVGGFNALYLSTDQGSTWTTLSDNTCQCNNIMGYDQNGTGGQAPRDMDILVSPTNPNIIHVAGVETWKSTNQGQSWTQTTEWNNPGGSNFIHADIDLLIYDDTRIIAGTDGGIYYSTDDAATWTDITSGLGIRQFYRIGAAQTDVDRVSGGSQDNGTGVLRNGNWYDFLGADGMETFIDWSNADIVYGTSQRGTLYKSIDGGNSRTSMSSPPGSGNWVTPFEQDPTFSNIIYTAYLDLWKSTDGGSSWTVMSSFNESVNADELKIAPSNNDYIYISYRNRLYISNDGGNTWSNTILPGAQLNYITVHPIDPERVAITISGSSTKIMESTDGGMNWTDLTGNIPGAISIECVLYEQHENGGIFVGGNPGIYFSPSTSNVNWTDISANIPKVRISELEIKNQILYIATYGRGLWKQDLVCDGSLVGLACHDFDPCTVNDVFDANCNCVGVPSGDTDGDGVCDPMDACPGGDDNMDIDNDGIPDFCDPIVDCDSCLTIVSTFPSTESFENGLNNICQFSSDDMDWLVHSGSTGSTNTGPTAAQDGSKYFYIESSSPNYPSKEAIFRGPCFDMEAASSATIDFWCHMYGAAMGTLNLNISIDQGNTWTTVWSLTGDQGDLWFNVNIDLSSYVGHVVTYAFEATTASSFTSDFALDLITVDMATGGGCSGNGGDSDQDGICADVDCDDGDPNIGGPGSACDDNDDCTVNDVLDANCNCNGTLADADGDGVCTADDCDDGDPNIGSPGSACDDNDDCTVDDLLDANCNCAGTFVDADGDGVCDANDVCPGGDDTIDDNNNGIPDDCDCIAAVNSFPVNPLTHTGSGFTSSVLDFTGVHFNASFSISDIDQKINGSPSRRFIDIVTVSYVDNDGISHLYGVYSGANVSSVNVDIMDTIQTITVSLEDGYDGNAGSTVLSVSMSDVNSCGTSGCPDADGDGVCDANDQCPGIDDGLIGTPCDDNDVCTVDDEYDNSCVCAGTFADADGDGVCDAEDICPGGDDNIDTDGDGIPDFCDCGVLNTNNFNPSTLVHVGTGVSTVDLVYSNLQTSVEFTVSDLGAKTNGNPNNRYIDIVEIQYLDENGVTQSYGIFSGEDQSSVSVTINDVISSVTVILSDGYDGNAPTISVNLSSVNSCDDAGSAAISGPQNINIDILPNIKLSNQQQIDAPVESNGQLMVYPNPTNDIIHVTFKCAEGQPYKLEVKNIFSATRAQIDQLGFDGDTTKIIDVRNWQPGLYMVILQIGNKLEVKRIVVQ